MERKLLAALLAQCVALTLLLGTALAADSVEYPVAGGNIYFEKATGAVTGCDWEVTAAVIPSEIEGVAVTSIVDWAFQGHPGLTSVVIPDSVTSIGGGAFSYCERLTSVVIRDGVTSIGDEAFEYCTSLTSVVIPDSVTSIGDEAFEYCTSLTRVVIPDSVTSIGGDAFSGCSSLTRTASPSSGTARLLVAAA